MMLLWMNTLDNTDLQVLNLKLYCRECLWQYRFASIDDTMYCCEYLCQHGYASIESKMILSWIPLTILICKHCIHNDIVVNTFDNIDLQVLIIQWYCREYPDMQVLNIQWYCRIPLTLLICNYYWIYNDIVVNTFDDIDWQAVLILSWIPLTILICKYWIYNDIVVNAFANIDLQVLNLYTMTLALKPLTILICRYWFYNDNVVNTLENIYLQVLNLQLYYR